MLREEELKFENYMQSVEKSFKQLPTGPLRFPEIELLEQDTVINFNHYYIKKRIVQILKANENLALDDITSSLGKDALSSLSTLRNRIITHHQIQQLKQKFDAINKSIKYFAFIQNLEPMLTLKKEKSQKAFDLLSKQINDYFNYFRQQFLSHRNLYLFNSDFDSFINEIYGYLNQVIQLMQDLAPLASGASIFICNRAKWQLNELFNNRKKENEFKDVAQAMLSAEPSTNEGITAQKESMLWLAEQMIEQEGLIESDDSIIDLWFKKAKQLYEKDLPKLVRTHIDGCLMAYVSEHKKQIDGEDFEQIMDKIVACFKELRGDEIDQSLISSLRKFMSREPPSDCVSMPKFLELVKLCFEKLTEVDEITMGLLSFVYELCHQDDREEDEKNIAEILYKNINKLNKVLQLVVSVNAVYIWKIPGSSISKMSVQVTANDEDYDIIYNLQQRMLNKELIEQWRKVSSVTLFLYNKKGDSQNKIITSARLLLSDALSLSSPVIKEILDCVNHVISLPHDIKYRLYNLAVEFIFSHRDGIEGIYKATGDFTIAKGQDGKIQYDMDSIKKRTEADVIEAQNKMQQQIRRLNAENGLLKRKIDDLEETKKTIQEENKLHKTEMQEMKRLIEGMKNELGSLKSTMSEKLEKSGTSIAEEEKRRTFSPNFSFGSTEN